MKSAFKDNVFLGKKLDLQAQMCQKTWKKLNLTYITAKKKKKKMALSSWMTIWKI